MKKALILGACLALTACGGSSSDKASPRYKSCKIVSSHALYIEDRQHDEGQCWKAKGKGYKDQAEALEWCEQTVNDYLSSRYLFGHTITYSIQSEKCPS